jgi:hypothetical protein
MLTWHMGCTWWRTHVRLSSCTLVLGPSACRSLRDRCTLQLLASCGVATPCLPACLHPPTEASAACVGGTAVNSCRSMVKRRGMAMEYLLVNRRLRSMGSSWLQKVATACAADSVQGTPDDAVDARSGSNCIMLLAESETTYTFEHMAHIPHAPDKCAARMRR